jgi:hypothetical protein
MSIRSLAWAGVSVAASCAAFAALLPVTGWLLVAHSMELTMLIGAWGSLSLVAVLVAGRLVFGRWLRVSPAALVVGCAGVGIAAVLEFLLVEWTSARFGYPDPDFVGWTAWLFALVVAVAMAAVAAIVAPPDRRLLPRLATIASAVLTLLVVALNARGLSDGIDADSWPLAVLVGLAGLYSVVAAAVALIQPVPIEPPPSARSLQN